MLTCLTTLLLPHLLTQPRVLNTRPHKVYYPTPRSLEMRLELAAKEATGVAIWELGQGYERFFDLL
jgi:spore germination protein YaaH